MNFPSTRLLVGPIVEPLTTAEAKAHVKVTHDDDDDYLDSLILSARRYVELKYNRALVHQLHRALFPHFPCGSSLLLPYGNLRVLQKFIWTDTAGTERQWTVSGDNLIDSNSVTRAHINTYREPAAITLAYAQTWPDETLKTVNPIVVEFWCGWESAAEVPIGIKQAMKLLIGHWYRTREAVVISDRASVDAMEVPYGVQSLLADFDLRYA